MKVDQILEIMVTMWRWPDLWERYLAHFMVAQKRSLGAES